MIQRQETKTMLCHTNVFISKDKQTSLSYLVLTCVEYDDAEKKQNLNKGTATILEKYYPLASGFISSYSILVKKTLSVIKGGENSLISSIIVFSVLHFQFFVEITPSLKMNVPKKPCPYLKVNANSMQIRR